MSQSSPGRLGIRQEHTLDWTLVHLNVPLHTFTHSVTPRGKFNVAKPIHQVLYAGIKSHEFTSVHYFPQLIPGQKYHDAYVGVGLIGEMKACL